ncbi:aspartate aminotransferase family protein [Nitratireductor basaltis]|uniref:Aminotransferase n=1 Tax=Nitratireductor basaltis TaxID=472175 RepID=A0A084UD75_9HYPH|nr:aspartate aminotransferase family protein [Nitratireductor basaltis]KFB10911.1 Aminotransferase [Nitratireductor basaltis]
MTRILHRQIGGKLPIAVGGQGVEIIDQDGRRYIDACGGAAVSCLGHGHPDIIAAISSQAAKMAYAHTGFFTNEPAEELAALLVEKAPSGISHAYFVSGGSEANEAALKMARQYFVEKGEPQRSKIIARRQSYHGNTLGALAAGGNEWRRAQFAPLLVETHHIGPCYAYRYQKPGEGEEEYGLRAANELETKILELGADSVMAFLAEPVVGATAGAVPAVKGYLKRVREICDQYGVLLILDEVMCGMGRTGTLFACEEDDVAPDIVTIAKGLGGGYQPIGAALLSQKIHDAFAHGSGFFQHGHTYIGHPTACAAALAVQKVMERDNLLQNVRDMGEYLRQKLHERFGQNPVIGDIRGRGLFIGIELVSDRETKEPFAPALKLHAAVKREAMARGLMVYPGGGTIDGRRGDHILLAPPFIINREIADEIVSRLDGALSAAVSAASSTG